MSKPLTNEEIENYVTEVSLPKDKYKNMYFCLIQELSDGNLVFTMSKSSPYKLWEFVYRKYYGGSGSPLLSIITGFNINQVILYYASNKLKNDDYCIDNFTHLHLIRLSTLYKGKMYFIFSKHQLFDVVEVLSSVYKLKSDEIRHILSDLMKQSKNDVSELVVKPKPPKLKPIHNKQKEK